MYISAGSSEGTGYLRLCVFSAGSPEGAGYLRLCVFLQARQRALDIYGRFGFTVHTGNTPDPMMRILRDIRDEEQTETQQGRLIPGNLVSTTHKILKKYTCGNCCGIEGRTCKMFQVKKTLANGTLISRVSVATDF